MNEKDFVNQLKAGHSPAYDELLKQFGGPVFNTCLSFLQNREDGEDVCQEVFGEIYRSIGQFNGESKLSTWIYRIAVSKSLEFLRKKKTKKRFGFVSSLFGKEQSFSKSDDSPFYHPGVQLENKELAATLFKAVDQLPENQRTAFLLHKIESLSYSEIAEVMKVSVSSVESLMVRAKQNLQKLLVTYYEENKK